MDPITGNWYIESVYPDLSVLLKTRQVIFAGKTKYQQVEVLDSEVYGRSLVLDGKTQSTELDEHIYHEALVHPAMISHPDPKTVFIGGGGEGATLREVLRHESVEKVVMLDLDDQVVDICKQYLPNHHQGSFNDSRVELVHDDAREYLQNTENIFDVMIMDLVDPLEAGTAYLLYTEEYYRIARKRLAHNGMLVTQSGPIGLLAIQECFTTIFNTLDSVFENSQAAQVHIPAFYTLWGFTLASDCPLLDSNTPGVIDERLSDRIRGPLKFYDGITHINMFTLPKFIRQSISQETRINRDQAPVFMV